MATLNCYSVINNNNKKIRIILILLAALLSVTAVCFSAAQSRTGRSRLSVNLGQPLARLASGLCLAGSLQAVETCKHSGPII